MRSRRNCKHSNPETHSIYRETGSSSKKDLEAGQTILAEGNVKLTTAIKAKDMKQVLGAQIMIEQGQLKVKKAREILQKKQIDQSYSYDRRICRETRFT
jgi:hypothetical protein